MKLRTIIADDEPLALRRLEIALRAIEKIEIVGVAKNGLEALDLVTSLSPDLLIIDIMMPGMDGFGLVEAIEGPAAPAIIFVTAYDQFALRAFEEGAVGYVLKPVDEDRLKRSVERVHRELHTRNAEQDIARLKEVVAVLTREREALDQNRFEKYLWAGVRGGTTRIPVDDVDLFQADGDYVIAHTGDREHVLTDSLAELEKRLNPARFLRVHRSAIVRHDAVAGIERLKFGVVQLRLFGGTIVKVSRTYRKAVLESLRPAKENGGPKPAV
jgi:two-component system, LytTR family, response regulator